MCFQQDFCPQAEWVSDSPCASWGQGRLFLEGVAVPVLVLAFAWSLSRGHAKAPVSLVNRFTSCPSNPRSFCLGFAWMDHEWKLGIPARWKPWYFPWVINSDEAVSTLRQGNQAQSQPTKNPELEPFTPSIVVQLEVYRDPGMRILDADGNHKTKAETEGCY